MDNLISIWRLAFALTSIAHFFAAQIVSADEIDASELKIREGIFIGNNDSPFSGTLVVRSESGEVIERAEMRDGIYNGLRERWHSAGIKSMEGLYAGGIPVGCHVGWFDDGTLMSIDSYATNPKFPADQLHFEAGLVNGIRVRAGTGETDTHPFEPRRDGLEVRWSIKGKRLYEIAWINGEKKILTGEANLTLDL